MPVARIGESVSYSDKLREQANLINQRRQQNLNIELAQEDRNKAFLEKQIAETYSFDTTGINPAFLPVITDLQAKISSHLDSKSSELYESKEDLIKDTNTLRGIYNVAKSNTEIGQKSANTYRGYLDGSVTLPDGQAFAGNKDVYDARYKAYEKGGLDDIQIEGSAGNYTITGFELMESDLGDGSFVPSDKRVNVLSSVSAIDPSYLFRPEVVKDSYLIPAEDYLKFNSVEQARSQASRMFGAKEGSIQQPYRASLDEDQPGEGWLEVAENDVTDENGTTKKGDYLRGQAELKESYLKEIEDFWNDNYQVDMSSSRISSGSVPVEVNGISVNAYQILDPETKKPVKPEVALPNAGSVNVSYVNASGEGDDTMLTMVYEIDGELQSETVGVSTGAGRSLIPQIGGEAGLVDLLSRQTDLKGTSNVNEGTVKKGGKEGEEEGGEEGGEEEAKVSDTLESQVADLDFEIQQLESSLSSDPKANQDLETISKLQEKRKEKEEIEGRLSVISSNDSGFSSNEEFDSYLKEIKEGDRWFRSSTPAEKLAKKIDGLTPTEQNKAIQEELDVLKNNFNDLSNKQSTPSVKIKMDENVRFTKELEKMRDALGYTEKASAIQGEGADLIVELPKIEPKGIVNVNLEPIKDRAPKAASVIEASIDSGEAVEVSVDAPIEEKREATKQTLLGIIKPGVLESEMEKTIADLISGVVGPAIKDSLFESQKNAINAGTATDPVPPWCGYWCADMIMRADPDFDFSSVRTKGGTEKDDPYNLGRAEKYLAIGEGVSESDGRYDARIGDVVIKKEGPQWHVGFFAGYDENGNVLILGGNQQDSLNITTYPYEQVQDVRRINVNAVSEEDIEAMSSDINIDGKTT